MAKNCIKRLDAETNGSPGVKLTRRVHGEFQAWSESGEVEYERLGDSPEEDGSNFTNPTVLCASMALQSYANPVAHFLRKACTFRLGCFSTANGPADWECSH